MLRRLKENQIKSSSNEGLRWSERARDKQQKNYKRIMKKRENRDYREIESIWQKREPKEKRQPKNDNVIID